MSISVFLEWPWLYFSSSQYGFFVDFNHCAQGNCTQRIRLLNTVNGPNSVYCCCQNGHRNEQSLKFSVLKALANGEEFSRWYKTSHFSSFTTNRALKWWLPKGQSSGVLGVWFLGFVFLCVCFGFFSLFFMGRLRTLKLMMITQRFRLQTHIEENEVQ